MKEKEEINRRIEIYKLVVAKDNVSEVLQLTSKAFELDKDVAIDDPRLHAYHDAIVMAYGRIFVDMEPVGRLSKKWGRYKDKRLQETHNVVVDHRNKTVGHTDHFSDKVIVYPTGAKTYDGTIADSVQLEVLYRKINPLRFPDIHDMASDLLERINQAIHENMTELYGEQGEAIKEAFQLVTEKDLARLHALKNGGDEAG